jgi:hypothetical protein
MIDKKRKSFENGSCHITNNLLKLVTNRSLIVVILDFNEETIHCKELFDVVR